MKKNQKRQLLASIEEHIETGTYTKSGILKRLGILYTETGNEGIEFSEFLRIHYCGAFGVIRGHAVLPRLHLTDTD